MGNVGSSDGEHYERVERNYTFDSKLMRNVASYDSQLWKLGDGESDAQFARMCSRAAGFLHSIASAAVHNANATPENRRSHTVVWQEQCEREDQEEVGSTSLTVSVIPKC